MRTRRQPCRRPGRIPGPVRVEHGLHHADAVRQVTQQKELLGPLAGEKLGSHCAAVCLVELVLELADNDRAEAGKRFRDHGFTISWWMRHASMQKECHR